MGEMNIKLGKLFLGTLRIIKNKNYSYNRKHLIINCSIYIYIYLKIFI